MAAEESAIRETGASRSWKSGHSCKCGFYTSQADYMLLHLKEQSTQCEWDDGQRALVARQIRELDLKISVASETITLATIEREYLRKIFQHKPQPKSPKARRCNVCHKPTMEMFGGVPQCAKHIAKGDVQVASILEEFLYGK